MTLKQPSRVQPIALVPLGPEHDCAAFDCGESTLNDWLRRRALANQASGASRCFVLVDVDGRVLAYYALAAGAVDHAAATGALRRNMPDPVPVIVLGRLAVDVKQQGGKIGTALLRDAVLRCRAVSGHAGVRGLLVHAINDAAKAFYRHYGFAESPVNPMTLMLRLA